MTAAYTRILIPAVNGSLFLDANPDSATWTGPLPSDIVIVQSRNPAVRCISFYARETVDRPISPEPWGFRRGKEQR